jgi:hypothetical protein
MIRGLGPVLQLEVVSNSGVLSYEYESLSIMGVPDWRLDHHYESIDRDSRPLPYARSRR